MKNLLAIWIAFLIISGCQQQKLVEQANLKDIAYEAFIYAYPMMEQVKTVNAMSAYAGLKQNQVTMVRTFPMENVGQPIVLPNLTSMTGGIFLDLTYGPVTVEIPEITDRYAVYQCIDMYTHNFHYMGTRADGGQGGQVTFYRKGQQLVEGQNNVMMEGNFGIIIVRIDIKDRTELERVIAYQEAIKVVSAPEKTGDYPLYDTAKAVSPTFVEYLNTLIDEVHPTEVENFARFTSIGVKNDISLTDEELKEVQFGIDSALVAIDNGTKKLVIGNDWFGATESFGDREFMNKKYFERAVGADFGLWGNSKAEANYFILQTSGEGQLKFAADELPPLSNNGFWSITIQDGNYYVQENEYGSYVLTMDKMAFEADGSLILKVSKEPQEGNWLYPPTENIVLLIRAYQADPVKIGDYVPPAFQKR